MYRQFSKRRLIILVCTLLGISGVLLVGNRWYSGTPYQDLYWSPNQHFFVQKYATWSPRSFVGSMPGQGSDSVDGFIRLHAKDGTVLAERWVSFMRDIKPVWADTHLYLLGIADMDENPWLLPANAVSSNIEHSFSGEDY